MPPAHHGSGESWKRYRSSPLHAPPRLSPARNTNAAGASPAARTRAANSSLVARHRAHDSGRHEDDELAVLMDHVVRPEGHPEQGNVLQERDATANVSLVRADESADDRGLRVVHHDPRVGFARV